MPIHQPDRLPRASDHSSAGWVHPAITRPEADRADRPAGVFASYVSPHRPARVSRKSMFSIYVALLIVTAAFGVLAAYQWERRQSAADQATLAAAQNEMLAQRVKELESLGEGLADMVALAFESEPADLLARLDDLEERRPDAAATDIFTKLWIGAKDRDSQANPQAAGSPGDSQFETASGAEPSKVEAPIVSKVEPSPDPKAEPAVQDRAKGDPAPPEPAASASSRAQPPGDSAASDDAGAAAEIAIAAKQESWIQIVDANGAPIFTKLMKPGDQHTLSPGTGAMLITGNPTGLALSVDGITAPSFNEKGPTRRQIMLDPARLLEGTAEQRK